MRTIFDVGSNNGDDIAYYLHKADRVIAFEANPILCEQIRARFPDECLSEELIVVNGVVCADSDAEGAELPFYIHKDRHVLSQFPEPSAEHMKHFDVEQIRAVRISDQIKKYGTPHYIKIDVEGYDDILLQELFRLGCFPKYISCEIHSSKPLNLLLRNPHYKGFKLVVGKDVAKVYGNARVRNQDGSDASFAFPSHSAGPFGEDILGPWYDKKSFPRLVMSKGFGWKDAHASRVDEGERVAVQLSMRQRLTHFKNIARPHTPDIARSLYRASKVPLQLLRNGRARKGT